MRREVYWFVNVIVALAVGMHAVDRAAAQQQIVPVPLDDEPELTSELPLPEHSMIVAQPMRDNSRAFFGVTFDPQVRDAAVARSVSAGSPADLAGVRAGDTIVSLNGQEIGSFEDVLNTVARLQPGDVLDVEISRRVSVRARAVLDGQPIGVEPTTSYYTEAESLPAPAGLQIQPPVTRVPASRGPVMRPPANSNTQRPRSNYTAPQNRNTNVNRDNNSNRSRNSNDRDRDNRGRSGFMRRRG